MTSGYRDNPNLEMLAEKYVAAQRVVDEVQEEKSVVIFSKDAKLDDASFFSRARKENPDASSDEVLESAKQGMDRVRKNAERLEEVLTGIGYEKQVREMDDNPRTVYVRERDGGLDILADPTTFYHLAGVGKEEGTDIFCEGVLQRKRAYLDMKIGLSGLFGSAIIGALIGGLGYGGVGAAVGFLTGAMPGFFAIPLGVVIDDNHTPSFVYRRGNQRVDVTVVKYGALLEAIKPPKEIEEYLAALPSPLAAPPEQVRIADNIACEPDELEQEPKQDGRKAGDHR